MLYTVFEPNSMPPNLITELKAMRLARQMTQEELALALGVTRQTIIALEQNRYEPSLSLALRAADYFKTSVETIFKLTN